MSKGDRNQPRGISLGILAALALAGCGIKAPPRPPAAAEAAAQLSITSPADASESKAEPDEPTGAIP